MKVSYCFLSALWGLSLSSVQGAPFFHPQPQPPVAPAPTPAPTPMPTADCFDEEYDIVIIGAGLAGIGAAYKLEDFIKSTGTSVSYSILEADSEIGGRAIAALEMSGRSNPLLKHAEDVMGATENTDFTLRDYSSIDYFNKNGHPHDATFVTSTVAKFEIAFECANGKYDDFVLGTLPADISIRQALDDCVWPEPSPGSLEASLEWYNIEWDLTESEETTGLYNFGTNLGFAAPPDDLGGEDVYFLKNRNVLPRNAASIAESLAQQRVISHIQLNTTVNKIDWNEGNEENTVKLTVTKGGTEACIRAYAVVITTSLGVLDRRGDCKYASSDGSLDGCDPSMTESVLFTPILPDYKMNALRELYIDETRSPTGIGEYRPIRFQFGENFWNSDKEFIMVDGTTFTIFENLDLDNFFKGSNALVGFLVTDAFDNLADDNKELSPGVVNLLLKEAILKTYGVSYNCKPISPGPFPGTVPGPGECVYSYFPGENKLWYGGYSSWKVTSGDSTLANENFENVFVELPIGNNDLIDAYVLWFTGAAYCDSHSEFIQGAWWGGMVQMMYLLNYWYEDVSPYTDIENTDEYKFCFKD